MEGPPPTSRLLDLLGEEKVRIGRGRGGGELRREDVEELELEEEITEALRLRSTSEVIWAGEAGTVGDWGGCVADELVDAGAGDDTGGRGFVAGVEGDGRGDRVCALRWGVGECVGDGEAEETCICNMVSGTGITCSR